MRISSLSLPHPVLGISDDVVGVYEVVFSVQLDRGKITLRAEHMLSNKTLQENIKQGKAAYCIEVNCNKTFYRRTFITNNARQEIEINANLLRDKVECDFFVTALVDIGKYVITEANSDYKGFQFYVEKGDVLAVGGHSSFLAEKEWQAYKAVSNFMEIVQDNDRQEGPIKIDLTSEKIIIHMAKEDYEIYKKIRRAEKFEATFHSSIVLPALIYALSQMAGQDKKEYTGLKWYEMLEHRKLNDDQLKHLDWTDSTMIPEIAQCLLSNPLRRSMKGIEEILESE